MRRIIPQMTLCVNPTLRERHRLGARVSRLQRCQALDVHLAAGTDTWVGPSPQACLDDLRMRRRQLLDHADALTSEGRRFLRIADELDARAAATPGAR